MEMVTRHRVTGRWRCASRRGGKKQCLPIQVTALPDAPRTTPPSERNGTQKQNKHKTRSRIKPPPFNPVKKNSPSPRLALALALASLLPPRSATGRTSIPALLPRLPVGGLAEAPIDG